MNTSLCLTYLKKKKIYFINIPKLIVKIANIITNLRLIKNVIIIEIAKLNMNKSMKYILNFFLFPSSSGLILSCKYSAIRSD